MRQKRITSSSQLNAAVAAISTPSPSRSSKRGCSASSNPARLQPCGQPLAEFMDLRRADLMGDLIFQVSDVCSDLDQPIPVLAGNVNREPLVLGAMQDEDWSSFEPGKLLIG